VKTIFVYGILQKDIDGPGFGLIDKYYIGRAFLYGYKRNSLVHISKSKREDSYIAGDIFKVPDELEKKLYAFEKSYGYERVTTKPQLVDNAEKYECISYIITKNE